MPRTYEKDTIVYVSLILLFQQGDRDRDRKLLRPGSASLACAVVNKREPNSNKIEGEVK